MIGSVPVTATPSGHRTRLPQPLYGNRGSNNADRGGTLQQGTPYRAALNSLDPNIYNNGANTNYGGMSAGIKVGRQQSGLVSRNGIGASRRQGVSGLNVR